MKKIVLLLLSFWALWGAQAQTGFINTFSECYMTRDVDRNHLHDTEVLHDVHVIADGQYVVFGKQAKNKAIPGNPNGQVAHLGHLDAFGTVVSNMEFTKNDGLKSSVYGKGYVFEQLQAPICNSVNWLLLSERQNNKTDVIAYTLDNSFSTVLSTFSLTDINDEYDYVCYDFIQNQSQDLVWVGSRTAVNGTELVALGTYSNDCFTGGANNLHTYTIMDPLTQQPIPARARDIERLDIPLNDQAFYALTGKAGRYNFCLFLDQNYHPVNSEIYLFNIDNNMNTIDEGVRIKQLPTGDLVVAGNLRHLSNNPGFDELFLMEVNYSGTLSVNWANHYSLDNLCTALTDFHLTRSGHFVAVGLDSYDCSGQATINSMDPRWATMMYFDPLGNLQWARRHHFNNKGYATPYGTAFNALSIVEKANGDEEFIAVGSCTERKQEATSDGEEDAPESTFRTYSDYFAVKTDRNGNLLDNSACFESIDLMQNTLSPAQYNLPQEVEIEELYPQSLEAAQDQLAVESDFCDQTDNCCQEDDFQQLLSQGGSYIINGCQSVTVQLNAVGECWQVTWHWGDGTTTGPIPATTAPITHNYTGINGAYIYWEIEAIDRQGNPCNYGTMDFGVAFYLPPCECQECPGNGLLGPELIQNGDFSNGLSSFSSAFATNSCSGASNMEIHDNLSVQNCNASWCGTGTSGTTPVELDPFLVGDAFGGPSSQRDILWEQTVVGLEADQIYTFCANFKNLVLEHPTYLITDPVIDIEVNGQPMVTNRSMPVVQCETTAPYSDNWEKVHFLWNAGSNSTATIRIYLYRAICLPNCAVFGADLGVDDISFRKCTATEGGFEDESFSLDGPDANSIEVAPQSTPARLNMRVFPNPARDLLQVAFEEEAERNIRLYNMNGQLLRNFSIRGSQTQIEVIDFTPGVYTLLVQEIESGKMETQRIIISR